MQIDPEQSACPKCGAQALEKAPVLHHMICAYVGPEYDFDRTGDALACPKCQRALRDGARDWEIVGTSALCRNCGGEFVVTAAERQDLSRP